MKILSNPSAGFTSSIIYVSVLFPASTLSVNVIISELLIPLNNGSETPFLVISNSVPLITSPVSLETFLICNGILLSGAFVTVNTSV